MGEKTFTIRIYDSYRSVVALCDTELLDNVYSEGQLQLDLTGQFFKGEKHKEKEIIGILQRMDYEDATFNVVGTRSIELAKSLGMIEEQGIKTIQNIPFALVLL